MEDSYFLLIKCKLRGIEGLHAFQLIFMTIVLFHELGRLLLFEKCTIREIIFYFLFKS